MAVFSVTMTKQHSLTLTFVAVVFLALSPASAQAPSGDENTALAEFIKKHTDAPPPWLDDLKLCPADHMPAAPGDSARSETDCSSKPDQCLTDCDAEDQSACISLALAVQTAGAEALSEALFFRACKLGAPSGCTNRAAAMLEVDFDCGVRTFGKTCSQEDPWGCTMLGSFLALGKGMPANPELARRVLAGSCKYGESDPACQAAMSILDAIAEPQE